MVFGFRVLYDFHPAFLPCPSVYLFMEGIDLIYLNIE